MDNKVILYADTGDEQPERDPLRPVAGTVIEGLVAVYEEDSGYRFIVSGDSAKTLIAGGAIPGYRMYRFSGTIEGEIK